MKTLIISHFTPEIVQSPIEKPRCSLAPKVELACENSLVEIKEV
jgi:hypothetical protein